MTQSRQRGGTGSAGSVTRRNWDPYTLRCRSVERKWVVEEREVGVEQVEDAPILANDRGEEQLGLARHRLAESSKLGNSRSSGCIIHDELKMENRKLSRPAALGKRLGAGVGEHPMHLRLEHSRTLELTAAGQIEQLVVGNAAPKEERQSGGELQIRDRVRRIGRDARWIEPSRKQEFGTDEQPLERPTNPELESALDPPLLVEGQERPDIGAGDGPTEGAPGKGRHNPLGTGGFVFADGRARGLST